jgi:hypothetical protein
VARDLPHRLKVKLFEILTKNYDLAFDYEQGKITSMKTNMIVRSYELADRKIIRIGSERFVHQKRYLNHHLLV